MKLMTLEEVAKALGVSLGTARRIEREALRKAREIMEKKGYKASDFYEVAR